MIRSRSAKLPVTIFILAVFGVWLAASPGSAGQTARRTVASNTRSEAGLAAWDQVYSVLTHPRCINCHTATNYPQQGDDRHRHFANVVRGPDGFGVAGLSCATCHQATNANSTGAPGSHNWHLAPLSMAWQDRNDQPLSSAQVCRVLTDRSKNHGMDGPALLKHHAEDELVGWAWEPGLDITGAERTLPPLSRPEFADATRQWVEAGTPCPPGR
jgi:mono/diheme cytochrome c family protein